MSRQFGLRVRYAGVDKGLYPLKEERTAVGRGLAGRADICVEEPLVSGGKHFFIDWDAETQCHVLKDLGHPNRIQVNGVEVGDRATLRLCDGDEITIGQSIYRYEAL